MDASLAKTLQDLAASQRSLAGAVRENTETLGDMSSGGGERGGFHPTTRFTTPSIGGFRAFFGAGGLDVLKKVLQDAVTYGYVEAIKRNTAAGKYQQKLDLFERTKQRSLGSSVLAQIKENDPNILPSYMKSIELGIGASPVGPVREGRQGVLEQFKEALKSKDLGKMLDVSAKAAEDDRLTSNMKSKFESINKLLKEEFGKLPEDLRKTIENRFKISVIGEKFEMVSSALGKLGATIGIAIAAFVKFRDSLISTSQELGGVSLGQAFEAKVGAFVASLEKGLAISGGRILETRGALAQEFGRLATTEAATRITSTAQKYGLIASQIVGMERALQSISMSSSDALEAFKQQGIVSGVAADELVKNAAAVARAGDNFNSYIAESISNAKRLGVEFQAIEQQLTGISTNFEGTVEDFAGLRALIPGFETDFNQLFSTALYGSTDDFIGQIREGLLGAGVTSTAGMSRVALAQLQQATGFSADQLDRILKNQDVNFDTQMDLDGKRNKLLNVILKVLGVGFGAIVGLQVAQLAATIVASGPWSVLAGVAAAAAAAGFAWRGSSVLAGDDIVSKPGYGERTLLTPQGPVALNNQDNLVAYADDMTSSSGGVDFYDKGELAPTSPSINMSAIETKLDRLISATERQTESLRKGLRTEIVGIDKGLIQLRDAENRGLVYG